MTKHCSDQEILELLSQTLTTEAQQSTLSHCNACEFCLKRLEELSNEIAELGKVPEPTDWIDAEVIVKAIEEKVDGRLVSLPDKTTHSTSRLRFVKSVDTGGFGHVFEYHDEAFQRPVAIKILQDRWASNLEVAERFRREMAITASIDHPGCPAVFGSGKTSDGRDFFWMQLIEGPTLQDEIKDFHSSKVMKLNRRSTSLRNLLRYFQQICSVIHAAHNKKVLHRDLKPSNVRIHSLGHAVVLDWGLATRRDHREMTSNDSSHDDQLITHAGARPGTLMYMAPEVSKGDLKAISEATDIFGLGAILYEILTGLSPYAEMLKTGLGRKEILKKISIGYIPSSHKVPRELVSIYTKAMSLNPQDRYSNSLELSEEIEKWLTAEPLKSHKYSIAGRGSLLVQRFPMISISALLFIIALFSIAVLGIQWRNLAERNRMDALYQSTLADKRFGLALDAYRGMATEIQRDLKRDGESKELRKKLIGITTQGIQSLLSESQNSTGAELVSLRAKLELASITNSEENDTLKAYEQFKGIYNELVNMNSPSRTPDYFTAKLTALRGVFEAESTNKGLTSIRPLLEEYQSLASEFRREYPKEKSAIMACANSEVIFARYILDTQQNTQEAIQAYRKALTIWQGAPEDIRKANAYAILLIRGELANLLFAYEPKESLREKEQIVTQMKLLCEDEPIPLYYSGLITDWDDFAKNLRKQGSVAMAINQFEQARDFGRKAIVKFPFDKSIQSSLKVLEHNLAAAYRNNEQPALALEILNSQKIDVSTLLASDCPIAVLKDQASTHAAIALNQIDMSLPAGALETYLGTKDLRLEILDRDPLDVRNELELCAVLKAIVGLIRSHDEFQGELDQIEITVEQLGPSKKIADQSEIVNSAWAAYFLERGLLYSQLFRRSAKKADLDKASDSVKTISEILRLNPNAPSFFVEKFERLLMELDSLSK